MRILALDTAMAACSAALIDTARAEPLAACWVAMERGHAEAIAPMVESVMAEAGIAFREIDRIAVSTGPGTFTGVRIGLAFARGLGLALGVPVIGIDSLSAIAANDATQGLPLLAVSDARNLELHAALFDGAGRLRIAPRIMSLADAVAALEPGAWVTGTAADAVIAASARTDVTRSRAGDLPVARNFGRLAAEAIPDGMPSPLYLRAPDARPQAQRLRPVSQLTVESDGPLAAELLAAIHAECADAPWTAKAFHDLLATPGTHALTGSEHGEPLGFVLSRMAADEAEIIMLATRPQARRRGVARRLLEQEAERLRTYGVASLFLEVNETNAAARSLYLACGFVPAGRRKAYYARPGHAADDAIVMRRALGA